jgi:hypothetical protein
VLSCHVCLLSDSPLTLVAQSSLQSTDQRGLRSELLHVVHRDGQWPSAIVFTNLFGCLFLFHRCSLLCLSSLCAVLPLQMLLAFMTSLAGLSTLNLVAVLVLPVSPIYWTLRRPMLITDILQVDLRAMLIPFVWNILSYLNFDLTISQIAELHVSDTHFPNCSQYSRSEYSRFAWIAHHLPRYACVCRPTPGCAWSALPLNVLNLDGLLRHWWKQGDIIVMMYITNDDRWGLLTVSKVKF